MGDQTGLAITSALREAVESSSALVLPKSPLTELEQTGSGWRARCGDHVVEAGAVVLSAGGRCFREAEERGELTTNHPGATGETTQIALGLGAESRDLDALQYHPNGGTWPENLKGYSIPETTRAYGAVLVNADGEEFTDSLAPRDEVSQAIFDEVEKGKGVETPGRHGPPSGSTRRGSRRPTRRSPSRTCSAATGPPASTRSPSRSSPIQSSTTRTAGLVIDEHGETTVAGPLSPAARSRAARTAATG